MKDHPRDRDPKHQIMFRTFGKKDRGARLDFESNLASGDHATPLTLGPSGAAEASPTPTSETTWDLEIVVFCAKKTIPETVESVRWKSYLLRCQNCILHCPRFLAWPIWACVPPGALLSMWISGHDARQFFFHPPLSQIPSDPHMLCNRASLIKQEQALPWRVCHSWNPPSPTSGSQSPPIDRSMVQSSLGPQTPDLSRSLGPMPFDLHVPRM